MPIKRLTQSSLLDLEKYSSMLAGNTAFSPNSFDLLETTVLSSEASSVTFSNLGNYSDYKHLQLRATVKFTGTTYVGVMRVNGVSALSSYSSHRLYADGSSVASQNQSGDGGLGTLVFPYLTTNAFGGMIADFLDFSNTNKFKTVRTFAGISSGYPFLQLQSGAFLSTNAITSISIHPETNNLAVGSRFSLYGIK